MRTKMLFVAGLMLVVTAGLLLLFRDGDERKLRRSLDKMAATFEKKDQEGLMDAARRSQFMAQQFVAKPEISVEGYPGPLDTQNDIQSTVFQIRSMARSIDVSLFDLRIELMPNRAEATMNFTARAQFNMEGTMETVSLEFQLLWTKVGKDWLINGLEAREVSGSR
ncbi:MAG: hypothetical protein V2A34_09170 [Lentisphaerota bacterium]